MLTQKPPSELTMKIIAYKRTGKNLAGLIEEVALLVYEFPVKKLHWGEDDCSDFFCWFFPRVPSLIERFRYIGKDFEAYLYVTLKWQCRTYAVKRKDKRREYSIICRRDFWPQGWEEDSFACEHPPALLTETARKIFRVEGEKITDSTSKRRLIYITLKGADYITCHVVETVAALTGIDEDWIYTCVERLKKGMASKKERMELLRQKRNRTFLRIYRIHEDMFRDYDCRNKETLLNKLIQEKKRLAAVIDEMSRVPASPTHKDIAAVLGIPKGSIDSGIYYLKNALEDNCA